MNCNLRHCNKEEAEDAYFVDPQDKLSRSQPTDQFPKTQFQYNIKTSGVKLTAGRAGRAPGVSSITNHLVVIWSFLSCVVVTTLWSLSQKTSGG